MTARRPSDDVTSCTRGTAWIRNSDYLTNELRWTPINHPTGSAPTLLLIRPGGVDQQHPNIPGLHAHCSILAADAALVGGRVLSPGSEQYGRHKSAEWCWLNAFFAINAAERRRRHRRVFNHAAADYRQSARHHRRPQTPGALPPAK